MSLLKAAAYLTPRGARAEHHISRNPPSGKTGGSSCEGGAAITTTPLGTRTVDVIGEVCDRLIEDAQDGVDPVDASRSYSVSAVCMEFSVPTRDWPLFARWATDFLNPVAIEQLYSHVDVMIAERCAWPGDDLLSALIRRDADGDGLTADDLHTIVAAVLAGAALG